MYVTLTLPQRALSKAGSCRFARTLASHLAPDSEGVSAAILKRFSSIKRRDIV